jgi:uncharacterized protein YqgC (DUF456 family)
MPCVEPIGLVLVGVAIVIGLAGIIVVFLPGLLLVWGAVAVWALVERTALAWAVFALATVLAVAGTVIKYLLPGRRMRDAGVPTRSIIVGGLLGIAGFFLIPVVGLFIGFVLGTYLAERVRLPGHAQAWPATIEALKAVGLSILIELFAGLLIAGTWLFAAIFG